MKKAFWMAVLGLSCLAGCNSKATIDLSVTPPPPAISSDQAEAIARHAVDTNDGWAREADFFPVKTKRTWTVTARRFTGVNELNQKVYDPAQERYVVINESGKILAYVRGK